MSTEAVVSVCVDTKAALYGSSIVSLAHIHRQVIQMFIGSYQQTVLSSLEGWLRRGVVLSGAASVRTSQGDNAATMIVVFVYG